jgi:phosphoenolpyruvate carboxylase
MLREFSHFLNFDLKKANNSPCPIKLYQSWDRLVGAKLCELSLPQRIYKQTLYIVVKHPTYAHHLNTLSDQILAKIIQVFPNYKKEIKYLRFFFSEKAFQEAQVLSENINAKEKPPTKLNFHNPEIKKLKIEAEKIFDLSNFDDQEMRESLISIYIQGRLS